MPTKRLSKIEVGDHIRLTEGDAKVTSVKTGRWIKFEGGGAAVDIQFNYTTGPRKGQSGWHFGAATTSLTLTAAKGDK